MPQFEMHQTTFRARVEMPFMEGHLWKHLVVDRHLPDLSKPPFAQAPPGAPAYWGHPLVPELEINGWKYGAITDFLEPDCPDGCSAADGFVESPDGARAGIMWTVHAEPRFAVLSPPDAIDAGINR